MMGAQLEYILLGNDGKTLQLRARIVQNTKILDKNPEQRGIRPSAD